MGAFGPEGAVLTGVDWAAASETKAAAARTNDFMVERAGKGKAG